MSLSSQKYGFGIRDPRSGLRYPDKPIPDPGVSKALDAGSKSATLLERKPGNPSTLCYSTRNTEHKEELGQQGTTKTTGNMYDKESETLSNADAQKQNRDGGESGERGGEGRGRGGGTLLVFSRFRPLTLQLIWPVSTFPNSLT